MKVININWCLDKPLQNTIIFLFNENALRPIYTWVRFRIRLAHFPKYKNNYILKNGLAYCEIARVNKPLTSMNVIAGIFVTLLNLILLLGIFDSILMLIL